MVLRKKQNISPPTRNRINEDKNINIIYTDMACAYGGTWRGGNGGNRVTDKHSWKSWNIAVTSSVPSFLVLFFEHLRNEYLLFFAKKTGFKPVTFTISLTKFAWFPPLNCHEIKCFSICASSLRMYIRSLWMKNKQNAEQLDITNLKSKQTTRLTRTRKVGSEKGDFVRCLLYISIKRIKR